MNRPYTKHRDNESTCYKNKGNKHERNCCGKSDYKHDEKCVEDVLQAILEAQRKAKQDDCCETSCNDSINDLLGKKRKVTKNTIPFILYCGCEPFKGTGVLTYTCHSNKKKKLKCIDSFIFKVKDIKEGCAVLELLAFKCDLKYKPDSSNCHSLDNPCCQIDGQCVEDLMRTGICITVDLSNFNSISCLPAVYL
jgi:hypothetical protein